MDKKIKFSIICPFLNSEKFLGQAIDSVIVQSYDHWELILINDGSVDSSVQIAEKYALQDGRIKLISIENSGTYYARNEGIIHSSGDYLTFLDSDDYIHPNMLENVEKELADGKEDAVLFNLKVFSDTNEKLKQFAPIQERIKAVCQPAIIELLLVDNNFGYGLCGCVFHRKLFAKLSGNAPKNIRYAEDMHLAYQLFFACESVLLLPEYYYNYRMNGGSVTHNLKAKDYFDRFMIFKDVYNHIESQFPSLLAGRINSHIFWGFFNYITFAPKHEAYKTYKSNCSAIREDKFYNKYIKNYHYQSKKIALIKSLFNMRCYHLVYCILRR